VETKKRRSAKVARFQGDFFLNFFFSKIARNLDNMFEQQNQPKKIIAEFLKFSTFLSELTYSQIWLFSSCG
jgi:hypothetical protein